MGTIQIKKYERTVTVGKGSAERQKVKKTYGKIIYRGTLKLNDMAEHIMKHGSVYTEDVVIGVITKLKTCMQEMLADGYKVKLDGIGTLYPVLTSEGVADAKDYSAQENVTRLGISFLADQGKKSVYKASAMRQGARLSTSLYEELTGENEDENGNSGASQGGSSQGSGSETPSGDNTQGGSTQGGTETPGGGDNQGGNGGNDDPDDGVIS
jgi:predicted histone-like DNA-binding protein